MITGRKQVNFERASDGEESNEYYQAYIVLCSDAMERVDVISLATSHFLFGRHGRIGAVILRLCK
jgi:hypothetical protein